jgi:hypothetical protein
VPTLDKHILSILGEAPEALFACDIAERLNKKLRPDSAYTTVEVAKQLKGMTDQVAQLPERTLDDQAIDGFDRRLARFSDPLGQSPWHQ